MDTVITYGLEFYYYRTFVRFTYGDGCDCIYLNLSELSLET